MESSGTTDRPPMILTIDRPVDIIGRENMEIFTKHMRICFSSTNSGDFPENELKNKIGPADRKAIAQTLRDLRASGFAPLGINNQGHVQWGIVTKSKSHEVFEEGLPELMRLSEAELMHMGRSGYRKMVEGVKVQPPEDYEMNYETVVG